MAQHSKPDYVEPPNMPQVVAKVSIIMLADGTVQAQCQTPSPAVMLGMMEQAKIDLYAKLCQKKDGIEIAGVMQQTTPVAA